MKTIIALTIVGMMLLLPMAAMAQTGPGYVNYSRQGIWNTVDTFRMLGNGTKALFSGSNGESNAAFLGQWQANASMAGNASTVVNANFLGTMLTDSTAQTDLNYGFQALGSNASQIQCGNMVGPGATIGAITTGTGNCKTDPGKRGLSAVAVNRSADISSNYQGATLAGAQALAALIRGGLSGFALVQKGTVGAINPFSG